MALATITNTTGGSPGTDQWRVGTATLRSAANTATSYELSSELDCRGRERVALEFSLVHNDGTSYEWIYWWSPDNTNWYQATNVSASGGTNTVAVALQQITIGATGKWHDCVIVQDAYLRVGLKRTGGTGNNQVAITATLLGR